MSVHVDRGSPLYATGQTLDDLLIGHRQELTYFRLRALNEKNPQQRFHREMFRRLQLMVWALEQSIERGTAPPTMEEGLA